MISFLKMKMLKKNDIVSSKIRNYSKTSMLLLFIIIINKPIIVFIINFIISILIRSMVIGTIHA